MEYYTQRIGLRKSLTATYELEILDYNILLNCCKRYYDYIAWKYPVQKTNHNNCEVLNSLIIDIEKFNFELELKIPHLYRNADGCIDILPNVLTIPMRNISKVLSSRKSCDEYAILDFIEFIAQNLKDYEKRPVECGKRCIYIFDDSSEIFLKFRKEINSIFKNKCLLYTLNESKIIERVVDISVLSDEIIAQVEVISEQGIRGLMLESIELFKHPKLEDRHLAVEKIWDAFERLKTYHADYDKKKSASKILDDMSSGQNLFRELFNNEFRTLTNIGNNFGIRHHETNQIDVNDSRYYDYFFNRCLSFIALVIQYLK